MLSRDTFVRKKFNRLFLAGLLGWIVAIIGEMADSVLAGILISEEAVSAVELVVPIGNIIFAISLPVAYGSAMLFSRDMGAFDEKSAYRAVFEGVTASVAIGLVCGILLYVLRDPILDFYGASETIRELAEDYYDIYILIMFINPVFWCIYQLVLFDGDEGLILATDISMAVINAVVSFLLGRSLGVRGFAIGTLVSYVVPFFGLFIHFARKTNSIRFRKGFRMKEIGEMSYLGSGSALSYIYLALIDIIMNRFIIDRFGDIYLPAYAVVNLVLNLGGILICAFDGGRPFVTVAYGEKNNYGVKRAMRLVTRGSVILAAIMTILFQFLASYWSTLYAITSPEVVKMATFASRVIPLTYVALALLNVYGGYYPCVGEVFLGNLSGIGNMLIWPLALAIPLALLGGFKGMSIGFALTPVFTILMMYAYEAIRGRFKEMPLLLPPSDEEGTSFDLCLSPETISGVCAKIRDYCEEVKVEAEISNQAQLMFEETMNRVLEKNSGKKVLADVTVLVSPERLRLITRDNGMIFDITETDAEIRNLRCYVLAQLMLRTDEKTYATSISFNRNMFVWERAKA